MKILAILSVSSLLLFSCHSKKANEAEEKQNYEQIKETLEEKEKKNPLLFLSISGENKHNLIGQTVIKGAITNTATVCVYKDVQLELSYYSKTGTLLEKDNQTIYQEVPPGNTVKFKTKQYVAKDTDSVGLKIISASVK
ncbi:hypothetical protein [Ferruginibacter albus]|uniref:hypothetical protein n=1 Tax=Ferruginibacter albus TaxID=2875540 RepID=UPI001CC66795|nr:hypothetical protein [Ferruginibacter albus]UAY51404.1 hypothetical protein K9M53_12500 [Ferruginibacter albus]